MPSESCAELRERVLAMEIHGENMKGTIGGLSIAVEKLATRIETLNATIGERSAVENMMKLLFSTALVAIGWFANKIHFGN